MSVQLDRDVGSSLESLNELLRVVRKKQTGHIFDAEGIRAHLFDLARDVHPVILCISIAKCVGKRDLSVSALFLCGFNGSLKVSEVIETVKDTDPVDSVRDGLLDKIFNYVITVVAVAEKVLSAQKHLHGSLFKFLFEFSQSLPRIFLEEAQAGIECGTAPHLDCFVAYLVHFICNREHYFGGHSGRDQGLMRVTKDCLHNSYRFFNLF